MSSNNTTESTLIDTVDLTGPIGQKHRESQCTCTLRKSLREKNEPVVHPNAANSLLILPGECSSVCLPVFRHSVTCFSGSRYGPTLGLCWQESGRAAVEQATCCHWSVSGVFYAAPYVDYGELLWRTCRTQLGVVCGTGRSVARSLYCGYSRAAAARTLAMMPGKIFPACSLAPIPLPTTFLSRIAFCRGQPTSHFPFSPAAERLPAQLPTIHTNY